LHWEIAVDVKIDPPTGSVKIVLEEGDPSYEREPQRRQPLCGSLQVAVPSEVEEHPAGAKLQILWASNPIVLEAAEAASWGERATIGQGHLQGY
jgi:hypothetical protein